MSRVIAPAPRPLLRAACLGLSFIPVTAFAGGDQGLELWRHSAAVDAELAERALHAKEFTPNCVPSPFPTQPTGEVQTVELIDGFGSSPDRARLSVWRYPCGGDDAQLLLTFEPLVGTPFICSGRVTVVQSGAQIDSLFLNRSSTGLDSLCSDLLVPVTVYLDVSSGSSVQLEDDEALSIFYDDSADSMVRVDVPAYEATGGGGGDDGGGLQGGMSGTYFDPARAGEGVLADFGAIGSTPFVFMSWYTYENGNQLWLTGGNSFQQGDDAVEVELFRTRGALFGSAFDPGDVVTTFWGTATLRFETCQVLVMDYAKDGGESGSITMPRALDRLGEAACE